jgi:hypothetical protein
MISQIERLIELIERESLLKSYIQPQKGPLISHKNESWPLIQFSVGSRDPKAPVLFLVGGVHGLERIGAELCWIFLQSTVDRLLWDQSLRDILDKVRIVFIPLLNPYGFYHLHRSNPKGVDLMRNSPIDALEKTPWLLGGHRLSNKLPWFRGTDQQFEMESQFLIDTFFQSTMGSSKILAVDFHSGFGMKDRLWFPYSYKRAPFENLAELSALVNLFEQTYPYHIYQIEPQSDGYLLNGDLWDYLYIENRKNKPDSIFLPLTLEMGSWNWVRKNPLQIFSRHGVFNPMKDHRQKRTYRRHHLLFDFLLRSLYSHSIWSDFDSHQKNKFENQGLSQWYA